MCKGIWISEVVFQLGPKLRKKTTEAIDFYFSDFFGGGWNRKKKSDIYLPLVQGIPIVTLYSNLSILVGKISSVFLQILEYLLTDQGFESPSQSWYFWISIIS